MKRKKLSKKQQSNLRLAGAALAIFLVGMLLGVFLGQRRSTPNSLIWPADNTVTIPTSLENFLKEQGGCQDPATKKDSQRLWVVLQVEQEQFAKLAYGCSAQLQQYIMAVREDENWGLLERKTYFADTKTSTLASCEALDKHKIPAAIEPFCIDQKGKAATNSN